MFGYERCLLIFMLTQYLSVSIATPEQSECMAIVNDDLENCISRIDDPLRHEKSLRRNCNYLLQNNLSESICINQGICLKVFNITYFGHQLFANIMRHTVLNMLDDCCNNCGACRVLYELTDISQLNSSVINSSDIIFPVLGRLLLDKLYGFHFIPIFEVPTSYYFTLRKSNKEMMLRLISTCAHMVPFLIICLLMAFISGFIVWITEMRANQQEFPRPFHVGLFQGFWWSFISMTTVGYGDKSPKTYPGRIFAVFWILIGITMFSVFTATLTAEIINVRSPSDIDMVGKKVGIIKSHLPDSIIVAKHGGIIHPIHCHNNVLCIVELTTLLGSKDIEGFLINRDIYYYYIRDIKKHKEYQQRIQNIKMVRKEEKFLEDEKLSCGVLVKNSDDYNFFKRYYQSNCLQLETCNSLRLNHEKTHEDDNTINYIDFMFNSFLYYSLGIVGLIACFGICYETRRHCIARKLKIGKDGKLNFL